MELINLTPHPIQVYSRDGRDRIIAILPASEIPARVVMEKPSPYCHVYLEGNSIQVVLTRSSGQVTGLPDPVEGVYYVVSLPVTRALPERSDLIVPHDSVRNETGTIVGCRMFARPL